MRRAAARSCSWFAANERGLALGVRQTAIPVGAFVAALALPALADAGGSKAALLFLAALCGVGALVGALVLRDRVVEHELEADTILRTLGDTRLWRLSVGGALYLYAQVAVLGFGVLFLHDEHGFSERRAALVVAASQVLGAVFRIGGGRWSDVLGQRVVLLRWAGLAVAAALVVTAVLAGGPVRLLVPALAVAGGLSMAWNGLSFTAAAELAGPLRSGAALGFQQTVLSGAGVAAPVVFAASVSATSWSAAFALAALFPLAGWRGARSAPRALGSARAGSRATGRAVRDRRRPRRQPAASERRGGRGVRARGRLAARRGARGRARRVREPARAARPSIPEVWLGSHLDTVPQGGRFDGALGVVAAIEAVERAGARDGRRVSGRGGRLHRQPGTLRARRTDALGVPRAARRAGTACSIATSRRSGW